MRQLTLGPLMEQGDLVAVDQPLNEVLRGLELRLREVKEARLRYVAGQVILREIRDAELLLHIRIIESFQRETSFASKLFRDMMWSHPLALVLNFILCCSLHSFEKVPTLYFLRKFCIPMRLINTIFTRWLTILVKTKQQVEVLEESTPCSLLGKSEQG